MLCANYEFVQSMDYPAQSNDRYFVQQTMDYLRIPWIVYSALCAKYGFIAHGTPRQVSEN